MQLDSRTSPQRNTVSSNDPERKKQIIERILAGPDPYQKTSRSPQQNEEHVNQLLKKGEEIKQKHQILVQEQLQKIQQEHPFRPTISAASPRKTRDFKEFLDDQNLFTEISKMKKLKVTFFACNTDFVMD